MYSPANLFVIMDTTIVHFTCLLAYLLVYAQLQVVINISEDRYFWSLIRLIVDRQRLLLFKADSVVGRLDHTTV